MLKRKEILIHARTWMNLEDVVLSQQASHKKNVYDATFMS